MLISHNNTTMLPGSTPAFWIVITLLKFCPPLRPLQCFSLLLPNKKIVCKWNNSEVCRHKLKKRDLKNCTTKPCRRAHSPRVLSDSYTSDSYWFAIKSYINTHAQQNFKIVIWGKKNIACFAFCLPIHQKDSRKYRNNPCRLTFITNERTYHTIMVCFLFWETI